MSKPTRLRRTTLVAAPLFLAGVMALTPALAGFLWGVWNKDRLDPVFAVAEVALGLVGLGAFAAARGCFVEIDGDQGELRDVVGWVTRARIHQASIQTARVRAGAWRWFELDMDDGTTIVVAGASPAQFPARLLPGSTERDLADLDLILGVQDGRQL